MKKNALFFLIFMAISACAPAPPPRVDRVDPNLQTDISGRWNDTDSRLVAEEMISDVLSRPWLGDFRQDNGQKPVVIVGQIRNFSSEHINTNTFIKDLERELVNAGQVRFVASRDEREGVRDERMEQQHFASAATMKAWAEELGADFMLIGSINTITDAEEGQRAVFYQTDLELINIKTTEKVWLGNKKIKKLIRQDDVRW